MKQVFCYTMRSLLLLTGALLLSVGAVVDSAIAAKSKKVKLSKYESTFPIADDTRLNRDGVWRHPQFGLILLIDGQHTVFYQQVDTYCWAEKSPYLLQTYKHWFAESAVMSDNSSLHMRPDKKSNVFEFKVLQELPESCNQPIDRADVLRVFLSTMSDYYPAFARRGVNWLKRSTEIGARITDIDNDEDLLQQMAKSVEGLNDPLLAIDTGSYVWTDPDSESDEFDLLRAGFARQDVYSSLDQYQSAWHQAVRSRLKDLALSDVAEAIDGSVVWGQLASGAAYMHVNSFDKGSIDDWRKALLEFRKYQLKRTAVVLDLGMLSSTNDAIGSLFASAFLPEDSVLYKSRFHQRPEGSWNPHEQQWRGKQLGTRPLYVLTSSETAGAGERVVLALKGQPGITQVGTTTRGAMSEAFFRSLPNNWLIRLGSVEFADRNDVPYDGIGLVPDFNLAFFPEGQISQGHFLALQTLDELIAEGHFIDREQPSPKNTF